MNGRTQESKSEIRARIQELESFLGSKVVSKTLLGTRIQKRINVLKKKLDRSGKKIKTAYVGIKANKNGEITSFYGDRHTYSDNNVLYAREISIDNFNNSPEYSGLRKDIQKILAYISQHNTLPRNNSVVSKAF